MRCSRSPTARASREFARDLQKLGIELYATDGTREHLAADGIEAASVSDLTAVPPLVGGQVRTFHPAIYAGILARRDVPGSSSSSPSTASGCSTSSS